MEQAVPVESLSMDAIRSLTFEDTELLLTWMNMLSKFRPLSDGEKVVRKAIFAQHCIQLTEREISRDRTRKANAERIAAGLEPVCYCAAPKVWTRTIVGAQIGTESGAISLCCLSCGENIV